MGRLHPAWRLHTPHPYVNPPSAGPSGMRPGEAAAGWVRRMGPRRRPREKGPDPDRRFGRTPPGPRRFLEPAPDPTMRSLPVLGATLLLSLAPGGCDGGSEPPPTAPAPIPPAPVATVEFTGSAPGPLQVGGTAQLRVRTLDGAGNALGGRPVTWASSTPEVATVSSGGLVTGVAPGEAQITATSEGRSAAVAVRVLPPGGLGHPRTGGPLARGGRHGAHRGHPVRRSGQRSRRASAGVVVIRCRRALGGRGGEGDRPGGGNNRGDGHGEWAGGRCPRHGSLEYGPRRSLG